MDCFLLQKPYSESGPGVQQGYNTSNETMKNVLERKMFQEPVLMKWLLARQSRGAETEGVYMFTTESPVSFPLRRRSPNLVAHRPRLQSHNFTHSFHLHPHCNALRSQNVTCKFQLKLRCLDSRCTVRSESNRTDSRRFKSHDSNRNPKFRSIRCAHVAFTILSIGVPQMGV